MTAYATRSDLYLYGLPRGSLGNPGRLVDSSLAATSIITLQEHTFSTNDAVTLRATEGGTLSAPLVAGTVYYVIYLTDSSFQLAVVPNGSAITLTTDGVSMLVASDLPTAAILEFYSRFVDGFLPAHAVPLPQPYPTTVVAIVAELAAMKLQILSGVKSESMATYELAAKAQLERWAAGLPVRDAAITTRPANLSVSKFRQDNVIGNTLFGRGFGGNGNNPSDNGGWF